MKISTEERRWIVAIVLLLAGAFCISLSAMALFTSLTCDRDLKTPQVVDVSPLVSLPLPSDMKNLTDEIDLNIFDSYKLVRPDGRDVVGHYVYREENDHPSYSYIDVNLILFNSTEAARDSFRTHCEDRWYKPDLSDFRYGETEDSQFCISYTKEARADPEGLCRPLGYYYSFVVIRNYNLLINIREQMSDKTSTRKNDVIEQLAQELSD